MAPGHFNTQSKNFGGLHTGTGKYQNGGPYANNGYRHKIPPNHEFKEGRRVSYIGTHKDFRELRGEGIVLSKDKTRRTGRSFIRVKLDDGRVTYFHKNVLVFL